MSAVAAELRRARSLIALPGTWIQGAIAEDEFGDELEPEDDDAVAYCAIGAGCRARLSSAAEALLERTALDLGYEPTPRDESSVVALNDHEDTTQADVLALYDIAIEQAERGAA